MNEREIYILKAALIYAQSNLDDLNEVFELENNKENVFNYITVDGDRRFFITEDEITKAINGLPSFPLLNFLDD